MPRRIITTFFFFAILAAALSFEKNNSLLTAISGTSTISCAVTPGMWRLFGPGDGIVNAVVYSTSTGPTIIAGTNSGGIFKFTRSSNKWISIKAGVNSIYDLKEFRGGLYSASDKGIYRTLDKTLWSRVYLPNPLERVHVLSKGNKEILWASSDRKIVFTRDGINWSAINAPPASNYGNGILTAFFASSVNDKIYASNYDALFVSPDFGKTWNKIFNPVSAITQTSNGDIFVVKHDDRYLYVKPLGKTNFLKRNSTYIGTIAVSGNRLFTEGVTALRFSDDRGQTFKEITSKEYGVKSDQFWDIRHILPINKDRVLLAHDNGVNEVRISKDSLESSVVLHYPIPSNAQVNSLSLTPSGTFLTSYWDHISTLKSINCDANWPEISRLGSETSQIYLDPTSTSLYVQRFPDSIGLFRITNGDTGQTIVWWSAYQTYNFPDLQYGTVINSKLSPTKVYAIYDYSSSTRQAGLLSFNMTDDVSQLNLKETALPIYYAKSFAIDEKTGTLVVFADNKIYKSTDEGATWTIVADLSMYSGLSIALNPFDTSEMIVTGLWGNLTRVRGNSVMNINLPYDPSTELRNLVLTAVYDDINPGVVYLGSEQGFFVSKDSGITWKKFNKGLYTKEIRKIIPFQDKVFIGTWGSGNAVILKNDLFY